MTISDAISKVREAKSDWPEWSTELRSNPDFLQLILATRDPLMSACLAFNLGYQVGQIKLIEEALEPK